MACPYSPRWLLRPIPRNVRCQESRSLLCGFQTVQSVISNYKAFESSTLGSTKEQGRGGRGLKRTKSIKAYWAHPNKAEMGDFLVTTHVWREREGLWAASFGTVSGQP